MIRVSVTGHEGFLGRHVCAALAAAGHDVRGLRLPYGAGDARPDVLVHLAAVVGGIGFNRDNPWDCISANVELAGMALRACRAWGCRIVAVGSVCAYPKRCPVPFVEDDLWSGYPEETNAPYGVAKRVLLEMCRASGVQWTYLLPANLYGPGDNYGPGAHVIPDMITKMTSGAAVVTLWGDGTATREFLFVSDAARAVRLAVERQATMTPVNIGTGKETSISALAQLVADATGFAGRILWDESQPGGQPRRRLAVGRARGLLEFDAEMSLVAGLRKTVEDYKCRPR
jgi:GDP-L-fucose synthase